MNLEIITLLSRGVFIESCIYGILALGIFITFRVLDFPDLTVDGSFPMGGAIASVGFMANINPWFVAFLVLIAGFSAGSLTAVLHNKLRIHPLLASILTMTILYSLNIRIMGGIPNIQLGNKTETGLSLFIRAFHSLPPFYSEILFFFLFFGISWLILSLFFHTDLGITLGAIGNNPQMVIATGSNPKMLQLIGVGLANSLVAFSGYLWVQYQKFSDVGLGQGIVISGLAMVLLGNIIVRSHNITTILLGVFIGTFCYETILYLIRFYGHQIRFSIGSHLFQFTPSDFKIFTALLVIIAIIIGNYRTGKNK